MKATNVLSSLTRKDIERELCERSLAYFVRKAWHVLEPAQEYVHNWHIDTMCEYLQAVSRGEVTRLLVNVPPGAMKSLLLCVMFPAWEWTRKPHLKYLGASHTEESAIRDNNKMRYLIKSEWFQSMWGVELKEDMKTKFENTNMGFRQCCASTSLTGKRADRVIFDDPHSVEGAKSSVKRAETVRIFKETVTTRLINPISSAIIVIMQRLHEEDMSGVIIKEELGYEHLCLPMEYDPKRVYASSLGFIDPRNVEGELLFEKRFPKEVVERDKKAMGSQAVAGQFQQTPVADGGNIFDIEWFKEYSAVRRYNKLTISIDTAQKEGILSDYSVFEIYGEHEGGHDLIEVVRKRLNYPKLKVEALKILDKFSDERFYNSNPLLTVLIEDKSSGVSLIQDLQSETNYAIIPILPEKDKLTRASTCSPLVEAGKVYLDKNAYWYEEFKNEVMMFPNSTHDDQVDAMSQYLNYLTSRKVGRFTEDMY